MVILLNINDKEALAEVNEILKYTDISIVKMIPVKIIEYIQNNMSINSNFRVNENLDLFEQPIKQETKRILADIYRKYICTDSERKSLELLDKNQLFQEDELKKQMYNVDNLFDNKKKKNAFQTNNQNELVTVENKSLLSKFFITIKNFFHLS